MGLTLKSEQRLTKAGLVAFFEADQERWRGFAAQSHDYLKTNFPSGAAIRRDDVAETLVPLLEVDKQLNDFLAEEKLKEKYWTRYFVDLILDRCWGAIAGESGHDEVE